MKRRTDPKGKRIGDITAHVQLADFKTKVSPAWGMIFWFYIQLPCGGWVEFDIRHVLQIIESDRDVMQKLVIHNEKERLEIIAEMIKHLSIDSFIPQHGMKTLKP